MSAMHKFSSAMAGIGLALLQTVSLQVQAAPPVQMAVQILDPSGVCASWTTGGSILAPTITCNAGTPPPPGAPVCTISANGQNPLTMSAAGAVALSASCSNTDGSTTWAWTGAGASPTTPAGPTPGQQSLTVSATTTFGVVATNATGPSAPVTVTVTVGAPPPPPGPLPATCGNLKVVDMGVLPAFTAQVNSSGFGANTVAIATLKVPAGFPASTSTIYVFEVEGGGTWRKVWLSQTVCDMSATTSPAFTSAGNRPSIPYNIGGTDPSANVMQPGQTWYMMVVNQKPGSTASSCTGSCNIGSVWNLPK